MGMYKKFPKKQVNKKREYERDFLISRHEITLDGLICH